MDEGTHLGDTGPWPSPSLVLTDCHERVGELVLLFGRGQFVFERELLQRFTALQRLALPLTLHHLLQAQPHAHICRRRRPDVSGADTDEDSSQRGFGSLSLNTKAGQTVTKASATSCQERARPRLLRLPLWM